MSETQLRDRLPVDAQLGDAVTAPADPAQRIELLDALRGFALSGVCLANLFIFAYWDTPITRTLPRALLPTDGVAEFLMQALVEGRFYSIFSLLFGLGFALQLQRAEARGGDGLPLFKRRIRVLMLIGLAHLLLLWFGDILLFYALMALVLMRMRHMSDRRVLRWAAACILIPVVLYLPIMISQAISLALPFFALMFGITKLYGFEIMKMQDGIYTLYTSGNIVDWFKLTTMGIVFRFGDLLFVSRPFKVLAMFLIGMYVGRHRMWADLHAHAPLLRRIAWWGFLIGLPAGILHASIRDADAYFGGTWNGLSESVLYAIAVAPMALAYAASFALLWRHQVGERVLRLFAPAGKMALTNYLMQTVIATIIFSGFGLRLAGRVGPTYLWVLAIAILAFQILLSKWWLARFRFGPMEWVWRSATYRARQPMQRKP
jgi:uncharacterized protein